jgi:hypothetical protein
MQICVCAKRQRAKQFSFSILLRNGRAYQGVTPVYRVGNVPVPQVVLNGPCVLSIIGQLVTRRMSQHVGMNRERQSLKAEGRSVRCKPMSR